MSFYFDGRRARGAYGPAVVEAVLEVARIDAEAVIGRVNDADVGLDVEFVDGRVELENCAARFGPSEVAYGAFPAADNDGQRAVTITLPDRDGIVRSHPY